MSKLKWTKNCPSLQMPLFSKILLLTISSILVTKIRGKFEYTVSSFLLINVDYIRIMLLLMKYILNATRNTQNTQKFLILVRIFLFNFFLLTCTFNYSFIDTELIIQYYWPSVLEFFFSIPITLEMRLKRSLRPLGLLKLRSFKPLREITQYVKCMLFLIFRGQRLRSLRPLKFSEPLRVSKSILAYRITLFRCFEKKIWLLECWWNFAIPHW
jgi:hypothetical protein